jgi:hypothetical protein
MDLDLTRRLAVLLADPNQHTFSADDVTLGGKMSVDPEHEANSKQSAIGSAFRKWAKDGYIEWTGRVVNSKNPRRNKGMVKVWKATDRGKEWAELWLEIHPNP